MANFSRRVVLDVGGSEVRIAEILPDRKGLPVFSRLRSLSLNIDPTKTADFFPAILQSVDALVREAGIKPGPTTLCLGGPSVFARVIKVPQTDPSQVRQMIGFEAQQVVPAIEEACWDFQLFPSGGGGDLEAMILAIKKENVREVLAACSKAGLAVEAVELAPMALINAFRYNYPDWEGATLILDVGARSTNILIVEGTRIFCRVVPLGGAAVTQAIATDLQESFAGAETLKKAKGFIHPGGSYEDPADEIAARISKLSRGVVTRLHNEVERSVTFYRSQQGGGRPTQVLLSGGAASSGLLDFFFREKLKIPVQYFQPFRRVGVEGMPMDVQRQPWAWVGLVGAGLRSLAETPCRIQILDKLETGSPDSRLMKPAMIVGGLAATLLLLLPGGHGFWQAAKIQSVILPQTSEVEEAERAFEKINTEQKKVDATFAELDVALQLKQEQSRWPRLLAELQQKIPPGLWITRLNVVEEDKGGDSPAKINPGSTPKRTPVLEIGGMFETKSEEADAQLVEQFRSALDSGKILQKVVTSERETPERSPDGKTEQVALRFSLRAEWPPRDNPLSDESGKPK